MLIGGVPISKESCGLSSSLMLVDLGVLEKYPGNPEAMAATLKLQKLAFPNYDSR